MDTDPSRRAQLYALPGDLPPRDRQISATQRQEAEHDGYVLETAEGRRGVVAFLERFL